MHKLIFKNVVLSFFLAITVAVHAQTIQKDTARHVHYTDESGMQKKALIVSPPQILIIDGDSIFTVQNEIQLRRLLEIQKGFTIINNPDSISSFLRRKIKAIVIIRRKE